MQAIIKLKPSEFNTDIINKMKEFLKGRNSANITITISDEDDDYMASLRRSVWDAENNKDIVTFTIEEFEAYHPKA